MGSSAKVLLGIPGTGKASEWGLDWEMGLPEMVHGDLTGVGWLLFNKFVLVVNSHWGWYRTHQGCHEDGRWCH